MNINFDQEYLPKSFFLKLGSDSNLHRSVNCGVYLNELEANSLYRTMLANELGLKRTERGHGIPVQYVTVPVTCAWQSLIRCSKWNRHLNDKKYYLEAPCKFLSVASGHTVVLNFTSSAHYQLSLPVSLLQKEFKTLQNTVHEHSSGTPGQEQANKNGKRSPFFTGKRQ